MSSNSALLYNSQAGPVIKVKIPKDKDGKQKQFAFVSFKHEESVPYGMNLLNGIKLYGRPINIQFRSGTQEHSVTLLVDGKKTATTFLPPYLAELQLLAYSSCCMCFCHSIAHLLHGDAAEQCCHIGLCFYPCALAGDLSASFGHRQAEAFL